jgi:AcrR family transcriptional regulator
LGYVVKMPRPRKHNEETRAEMIVAAERLIAASGPEALSVRDIAHEVGTSTWAVYSLFGSREGLLEAVAVQAFGVLDAGLRELPETDDPAADLVEAGTRMYRRFVLEHPWLFRLAFQRVVPDLELGPEFFEARASAWVLLEHRLQRLKDAGRLGDRSVQEGAVQFNALCEGLGNAELRGGTLVQGDQEPVWRRAFEALIRGFCEATRPQQRGPRDRRRR